MLKLLLWLAGIAALLLGLDRLLLHMESRGWIYYRKKKPSPGTVGGAFLEVQNLVEPSKKYVIRLQKEDRKDQSESGEPPESGVDAGKNAVRNDGDAGGPET